MDVRQLEYFLAVVENGGFGRAARARYVAQPSLSQSIRLLERDLGSELFHRFGRRVVLTEAGRALVEPARAVVHDMAMARASVASVHGLVSGRVEIAVMPSQAVDPLSRMIAAFAQRYPGVSVTVRSSFTPADVLEAVRTGVTELGLLGSMAPVTAGSVQLYPVARQRFVLVTPPDGPFPAGLPVRREQLTGQRLIAGQPGTGMRAVVDAVLDAGVGATIAVETEHREAILPLVLNGTGLAVLADSWRDLALRAGARVLDLEPEAYLNVALVARPDNLTPAAREFLTIARGVMDP
ncbi:MAG TPA: LysR family transcriptional regulator [Pseudonocardia sp.]|uniref:LysR family transcriptional regulator n=1 Tax=Pseudonocardia sp. TaxID=60912 RepID=UPI002BF4F5B9|nr:LysR family transcriptional regulator [Pseudonocardia sp.]HTF51433.1 LysR family transcriptional regulator [Pseudonocardia sp.]